MDIKKKVEELALTLPECPAPLAAYVPATRFGNVIAVSGQLPSIKGDFSAYCGSVPNELPLEKAVEAARICLLNNIAAAMTKLNHGETLKLVQSPHRRGRERAPQERGRRNQLHLRGYPRRDSVQRTHELDWLR